MTVFGHKRFPIIIAVVILIAGAAFWRWILPAIRPPFFAPPGDITKFLPDDSVPTAAVNETNLPLKLPPGFAVSIFAKNLPGARVMSFDRFGNLWASRTSEGAVTLLEIKDGRVVRQDDIFRDLRKPHGLAFDPADGTTLYIAEEHRVRRFTPLERRQLPLASLKLWRSGSALETDVADGNVMLSSAGREAPVLTGFATYSEDPGTMVLSLPSGGGHFTRTLGFGPDGQLYVSIGSSCNACRESDDRRASILRYNPATGKTEIFARGLRNAVFFTWDYVRGKMWATEMGRDWLGDDLPPDEINIIKEGKNYGWPTCYGKNVHDAVFDKNVYVRAPCSEPFETPSFIDIPAHSAPLGLAFIPEEGWPKDYWYDLLAAYHGSWNRSEPTGYKVVRHKFDAAGNYEGVEDFITGWLTPEGALGRPVDIIIQPGGVMYLSDDKAGVIYKIVRRE